MAESDRSSRPELRRRPRWWGIAVPALAALALLAVATSAVTDADPAGTATVAGSAEAATSAPTTGPPSTVPPTTAAPTTKAAPATTTTTTTTTSTSVPAWTVGARPLPLRSDGFGEVGPTPAALIDRRLATVPVLPAPAGDAFEHSIDALTDEVVRRMGRTWTPGCPVGLEELRYLTVTFWGFDGGHHRGELVVHRDVAHDVVQVFARLHEARFPIEEMRLITDADLDAAPTGDGNTTAAFVCRRVRQGSSWSAHALGLAVDINPFHNPYVRGDLVLPELAGAYLDRSRVLPGMVVAGDVATTAFDSVGWHWGGDWGRPDHMHFSADGR